MMTLNDIKVEIYGNGSFGQTKNNQFNGLGRLIKNDVILEGQFLDGVMDGYGQKVYVNGSITKGFYKGGEYVGQNATVYELIQTFKNKPDPKILTPI